MIWNARRPGWFIYRYEIISDMFMLQQSTTNPSIVGACVFTHMVIVPTVSGFFFEFCFPVLFLDNVITSFLIIYFLL